MVLKKMERIFRYNHYSKLSLFLFFCLILSSCQLTDNEGLADKREEASSISGKDQRLSTTANQDKSRKIGKDGIVSCLPTRLKRGETIAVKFTENHGNFLIIYPEKFVEDRSKEMLVPKSLYSINPSNTESVPNFDNDISSLKQLRINTENAKKENVYKLNESGGTKTEKVFQKSGWYNIVVGSKDMRDVHYEELFSQMSGHCRVFYQNEWDDLGKPKLTDEVLSLQTSPPEVTKEFFRLSFFGHYKKALQLMSENVTYVDGDPDDEKNDVSKAKNYSFAERIYVDQREVLSLEGVEINGTKALVKITTIDKIGKHENYSVCLEKAKNKAPWRIAEVPSDSS